MRSTKSRHRQHWPRHEPDCPLLSQPSQSSDQGLMVLLKVEVMQPEAFDLADFHAAHGAMSLRYNAQSLSGRLVNYGSGLAVDVGHEGDV